MLRWLRKKISIQNGKHFVKSRKQNIQNLKYDQQPEFYEKFSLTSHYIHFSIILAPWMTKSSTIKHVLYTKESDSLDTSLYIRFDVRLPCIIFECFSAETGFSWLPCLVVLFVFLWRFRTICSLICHINFLILRLFEPFHFFTV